MARLHVTTLGLAIWILGAASATAADSIARLSWLAGCWSGTQGGDDGRALDLAGWR